MKHILLIDDDVFIRDLVATKLTSHDYHISTAATAAEGLEALREHTPDLVLLDLELPDTPGVEVLRKIKTGTEVSSVPVIIFSNNDDPLKKEQAMTLGASAFLTKVTVDMNELHQELLKYT